ncbi:MAG: LrgB family protein [Rhodospirillaceae bacterium]|nr:LrgB family protein [Rhodospirillaceae bacterium]
MNDELELLWIYLEASPLMGLTATLVAYQISDWLWRKSGMNPCLNPVMLSILEISVFLRLTGIPYRTYFDGAQFIHFLLGPVTVALAVPLYRELRLLLQSAWALLAGLLAGSIIAVISAVWIAQALGGSEQILRSLAPKSATSPIAMGVAGSIGGLPSLAAIMAIMTGIIGSVLGPWILTLCRVRDDRARGLAMGTAAHGIGTAQAIQMGPTIGAFAGLGMGLNGISTALLVPLLVLWLL